MLTPAACASAEFDWRAVLAQNQALPPGAINDHEAVKIGGIQQWISVRGADPSRHGDVGASFWT